MVNKRTTARLLLYIRAYTMYERLYMDVCNTNKYIYIHLFVYSGKSLNEPRMNHKSTQCHPNTQLYIYIISKKSSAPQSSPKMFHRMYNAYTCM